MAGRGSIAPTKNNPNTHLSPLPPPSPSKIWKDPSASPLQTKIFRVPPSAFFLHFSRPPIVWGGRAWGGGGGGGGAHHGLARLFWLQTYFFVKTRKIEMSFSFYKCHLLYRLIFNENFNCCRKYFMSLAS